MRSPILKVFVLVATVASTALSSFVLWKSWEMVSTPAPTLDGLTEGSGTLAEGGLEGADRKPATFNGTVAPVVALDEVYVSLGAAPQRTRSLVVNLELELFEERGRDTVDKFRSAVRDLVLQAAMEQPYEQLQSLPGKLSFKEILVARINTLVNQPVIRNVHFASFYLQ
jgi:flagellar basal body-associated protein FliL